LNFRDYLPLAASLANGTSEAEWRSAVSRAYYSAFHVASDLLRSLGFTVPRADRAHAYAWLRLMNCNHQSVADAGRTLNELRGRRNEADYDAKFTLGRLSAERAVKLADAAIDALDGAVHEPARSKLTEAM
jgi:uncharacterized protein (UPF0332 family)